MSMLFLKAHYRLLGKITGQWSVYVDCVFTCSRFKPLKVQRSDCNGCTGWEGIIPTVPHSFARTSSGTVGCGSTRVNHRIPGICCSTSGNVVPQGKFAMARVCIRLVCLAVWTMSPVIWVLFAEWRVGTGVHRAGAQVQTGTSLWINVVWGGNSSHIMPSKFAYAFGNISSLCIFI